MTVKSVVRVATNNNFNCTPAEFDQLQGFIDSNPDKTFFVNSNARTKGLPNLVNQDKVKAVVTLNPDLDVDEKVVERGLAVGRRVSFYRVKWLPERPDIARVVESALAVAPVVITTQRFNSRAMMAKFTDAKHYQLECARFRLHGKALKDLERYVDAHAKVGLPLYICDRKGLGCLGCGQCATLNGAKGASIESLNLSKSGVCPFNCPDCYAKAMQKFVVACGNAPMQYDKIKRNKKQRGATKHIQNARKGK